MPSTRDIRRRIKSVKNTAQITKAMQMVAAAKMRRAQQAALNGRPYARLMNEVLSEIAGRDIEFQDPLMEKRPVKKRAIILVSSDKGLCGGLNSNLTREASKLDKDITIFICAGRKGSQFIARTKRQLTAEFNYKDTPTIGEARAIAKFASEMFLKGEADQVDILYTNFVSTLVQKPEVIPFLPVGEVKPLSASMSNQDAGKLAAASSTEYIFEPGVHEVFGALLPHYLNFRVYQILLEAKASEQSSRMVAMKNATDNAKQLIKDLTLEYNKLRQANITKELLEITSAAMAMG